MLQLENADAVKALHNWIHQEYARDAGLQATDFVVHTDETLDADIKWKAGTTIHIIIRFPFWHSKFKQALKEAFGNPHLLEMRRSKALIRGEDAAKWYSMSWTGVGKQAEKKPVLNTTVYYVTKLVMKDNKTKRIVEVELKDGNAFLAREIATKMLFGEKL